MRYTYLIVLLLFVGCDVFSSSEEPDIKPLKAPDITFPVEVEYRVYGTFEDHYGPIDYVDENNSLETFGGNLPWSYSFTLDSLRHLFVSTMGIENHAIISEIWINGELYSSLENTGGDELRKNLIWAHGENPRIRYDVSEWIQGGFDSGTATVNSGDGFDTYNLMEYIENQHVFFDERYSTERGFTATMSTNTSYSSEGCYLKFIALEVGSLSHTLVSKNVCQPGRHTLSATVPTK